jgi:hypothetical protein
VSPYRTTALHAAQERYDRMQPPEFYDMPEEDGSQFYILRITPRGYWRRETFTVPSLKAAARKTIAHANNDRRESVSPVVLRDGSTGKRYSLAQCRELLA